MYDYAVMELEADLGEKYGWVGIDTRWWNTERVEEVEVCGYPGDKKEENTMWKASGKYTAT